MWGVFDDRLPPREQGTQWGTEEGHGPPGCDSQVEMAHSAGTLNSAWGGVEYQRKLLRRDIGTGPSRMESSPSGQAEEGTLDPASVARKNTEHPVKLQINSNIFLAHVPNIT